MSDEAENPAQQDAPADAPNDAPAEQTPSFTVDVEAFKAAVPEGYDAEGAANLLSKHKGDVMSIVKQTMELEKSFSSRMPVPDPSNPEKLNEVLNKLGRPESPEGYQWGEGIQFRDDAAKGFLSSKLHEIGVTNDQANKLLGLQQELAKQSDTEYEQALKDGLALTDKMVQDMSGGIKGSKVYNNTQNIIDSSLKYFGVDPSDEGTQSFLATDQGRAVMKMAYEFGNSSQNGKIPGLSAEQTDTIGSLTARRGELLREMASMGEEWNNNPSKQAELESVKQQIRQMQGK
jgi:hypothetical protein